MNKNNPSTWKKVKSFIFSLRCIYIVLISIWVYASFFSEFSKSDGVLSAIIIYGIFFLVPIAIAEFIIRNQKKTTAKNPTHTAPASPIKTPTKNQPEVKPRNQFSKQERAEQMHKIATAPLEELQQEQIKPFGETASLAEFHQVQAANHFRIIRESLELINKTTYPSTFFGRYETAVKNAEMVIEIMKQYDASDDAEELLESLIDKKETLVDEFLDRCNEKGILPRIRENILKYREHLTSENINYMDGLIDINNV